MVVIGGLFGGVFDLAAAKLRWASLLALIAHRTARLYLRRLSTIARHSLMLFVRGGHLDGRLRGRRLELSCADGRRRQGALIAAGEIWPAREMKSALKGG
jgi:hypothetical protein